MRTLVTGGCGFLGHHVVEHLLKNSTSKIVVLDKLTYASRGFDRLRDIDAFDSERVRVIGCDLSQPMPSGVAREIGPIDYVVHAAAETHVDRSIEEPVAFLQANVLGTHHLLWWLKQAQPGLRRVLLVSTDEVYGPAGDDVEGFNEEAPFRPANPYAAAKAGGECIGMAYANTYKLPITIVNTMNLIGERQHPEKFFPKVIRSVLHGEVVPIHADPTLTRSGSRFYIHCRTYADGLLFLMRHVGELPLKLHICGEREISNLDLALLIAEALGRPLRYELVNFHASRPGHDLRYAMSDKRISELGWRRPKLLEESLRKAVSWYLEHPQWLELGQD